MLNGNLNEHISKHSFEPVAYLAKKLDQMGGQA